MKVLITSGGTKIKIDMVRHIGNMSSGNFGSKICKKFVEKGNVDEVVFLMAKGSKYPSLENYGGFCSLRVINYVTFDDYKERLDECLSENPDIVILAAAVSDYGVENYVDGKIRSNNEMIIRLKPLPKLISTVRGKVPNAVICGFKLLVNSTKEELYDACYSSIIKNKIDLVVGNDLRDIKGNNHVLSILKSSSLKSENNSLSLFEEFSSNKYDLADVVTNTCIDILKNKRNNNGDALL